MPKFIRNDIEYISSTPTVTDTVIENNLNAVSSNAVALALTRKQNIIDKVGTPAVKMIAHRGIWGIVDGFGGDGTTQNVPENSYESLKITSNKKYFGMEMDVQLASDGTFWISHNNSLSSTSSSNINISESTEAQLREVTLTNSSCGLPKLDEFMVACRKYNVIPVIELKSETITVASIPSFLKILQKTGVINSCFVMSYSSALLKKIYELRPEIPIQLITDSLSTTIINNAFENISPTVGFDVNISSVTAELCNYIHEKNSYIIGWTATTEEQLNEANSIGCDYVETETVINRAIPEMREADPVLLSVFPGVEKIYPYPLHTLKDTRIEYGGHAFQEGKYMRLMKANFSMQQIITNPEDPAYGRSTRAHGIALYAIPEDALYCETTLDVDIYKWNIMCLDGMGKACTDYPWCSAKSHRIYNSVSGNNPPKWGYIYCMRQDGVALSDTDKQAFEEATFTIHTDWHGSIGNNGIYRHGNQVSVSVNEQYSGSGNIITGLPKPASSNNYDNSIVLSSNSGGIIAGRVNADGNMVIDWSSGTIAGYLRGTITYTCADYWETSFVS